MKLTMNCQTFVDISSVVAKSISSKETQSQTTFKVVDESLIITHLGGTSLFKGAVPLAEQEGEFEDKVWVINSLQFKLILSVLPKDSNLLVELILDNSGTQFTVKAGETKVKLPICEEVAFIQEPEISILGEVQAVDFLGNLASLSRLTMTDEAMQNHPVSCIHLIGQGNELSIMATSAIALCEKKIALEDVLENFTILIKPAQAALLNTSGYSGDEILTLYHTKNMFGYIDKLGVLCLVSKIALEPLDYSAFKNQVTSEQSIELEVDSLKSAVDGAGKLCNNNSDITLDVIDNKLFVKNANEDEFALSVVGQVNNVRLSFNRHSLISLINILSGKVKLNWAKDGDRKIVYIELLKEEDEVDTSAFTIISTNNQG